jgi:acyl-CoA thioesterase FadM
VGVFDVDYLGHMNNAAFLSHAEYARWEMTAANGLVQAMYKTNTHYMVSSVSCRYRAEVRPLFRKFEVQSMVGGMDEKNIWMYVVVAGSSTVYSSQLCVLAGGGWLPSAFVVD